MKRGREREREFFLGLALQSMSGQLIKNKKKILIQKQIYIDSAPSFLHLQRLYRPTGELKPVPTLRHSPSYIFLEFMKYFLVVS